jgi:sugar lactone lactonase YvrE
MKRLILAFLLLVTAIAVNSCGNKITRPQQLPTGGVIGETTYVQLDPPWDINTSPEYNFNNPGKLIVGWDTYIYVCDTDNNRIVRLDPHGTIAATYEVPHPVGITQDELMRLLVVTGQSRDIYKIDVSPGGNGQTAICYRGTGDAMEDSLLIDSNEVFVDIANAPGYLKKYYVASADFNSSRSGKIVAVHNANVLGENTDSLMHTKFLVNGDTARNPIVGPGTGLGSVNHPRSILAFRRNGTDYILVTQDSSSFRTQLLSWTNNTYYKLGWFASALTPGADNDMYSTGYFTDPSCGAVDSAGNMYIVDRSPQADSANPDSSAFKFDTIGKLKKSFGSSPFAGIGQLRLPAGIAYDNFANRKTVYISDTGNNRILRFKLSTDIEQ